MSSVQKLVLIHCLLSKNNKPSKACLKHFVIPLCYYILKMCHASVKRTVLMKLLFV